MKNNPIPKSIEWIGGLDGYALLIDQTYLPEELKMMECRDAQTMWNAIKQLSIRGAPAIGIAAAMGLVLGVRDDHSDQRESFMQQLDQVSDYLASSRPTAVNLFWALTRMRNCAESIDTDDVGTIKFALLEEAKCIRDEDAAMCRSIGQHGLHLIQAGMGVLTHCNAGGLATSEFGTALAPMYIAHQQGLSFKVYADETRPLLQGSRLTAWELMRAGIDVTVICDSMSGVLMKEGKINLVITGADRIAANGDVANKIGTYSLAVLAKAHNIPFYVAAPSSTFDLSLADGSQIPIEKRPSDEIRRGFGRATAPAEVSFYNPAFDVTPADTISGIITEHGLIQPVSKETITENLLVS